jgi:hypothetical protein
MTKSFVSERVNRPNPWMMLMMIINAVESWYFPGQTDENHENLSGKAAILPASRTHSRAMSGKGIGGSII